MTPRSCVRSQEGRALLPFSRKDLCKVVRSHSTALDDILFIVISRQCNVSCLEVSRLANIWI